jgi:hypothetical protein
MLRKERIFNNTRSNSILFFIYLRAELNSQWSITESARIQTTAIRQHKTKQEKQQQSKENGAAKAVQTQTRLAKNICRFTN